MRHKTFVNYLASRKHIMAFSGTYLRERFTLEKERKENNKIDFALGTADRFDGGRKAKKGTK